MLSGKHTSENMENFNVGYKERWLAVVIEINVAGMVLLILYNSSTETNCDTIGSYQNMSLC